MVGGRISKYEEELTAAWNLEKDIQMALSKTWGFLKFVF